MRSYKVNPLYRALTGFLFAGALGASTNGTQPAPFTDYERQIVATVLILEAADQGVEGMRAVLHVIDNRAGGDPYRAVGVVARRKAFSCLNSVTSQAHPDYSPLLRRAMRDRMWPVAMQMVRDYEAGRLGPDITMGATHYCQDAPVSWEGDFTQVTRIGAHRFFR